MRVYRLGTARHLVWDGNGAALVCDRWNPPGAVIYAAGSLALAMLERFVQRGDLTGTMIVEAIVPDSLPWTNLLDAPPIGWRVLGNPEAVAAGEARLDERRTALLRMPSALVRREPKLGGESALPGFGQDSHRDGPTCWNGIRDCSAPRANVNAAGVGSRTRRHDVLLAYYPAELQAQFSDRFG